MLRRSIELRLTLVACWASPAFCWQNSLVSLAFWAVAFCLLLYDAISECESWATSNRHWSLKEKNDLSNLLRVLYTESEMHCWKWRVMLNLTDGAKDEGSASYTYDSGDMWWVSEVAYGTLGVGLVLGGSVCGGPWVYLEEARCTFWDMAPFNKVVFYSTFVFICLLIWGSQSIEHIENTHHHSRNWIADVKQSNWILF